MSHGLPTFIGDTDIYFAQLEAYFQTYDISPSKRLKLLYCNLPPSLTKVSKDLLTSPKDDATYDEVKNKILHRTTRSATSRFNELMADEQLGDRTPTEFLTLLRDLSGESTDAPLLRKIFFSRLPLHVQTILATAFESNTVDQVATMADSPRILGKPFSRCLAVY
ncbi:uncharacterized protein LOC106875535 [Octopus bimaculoides]|uniref:uncharacterized protein LOC106875535 n=1 Tax=Octopus bimaculoides TaxID=37653 RepID=UPI00071E0D01|nr:uncharacterized protein LOC106875535 [Octopus bimaculoides]|eukprot:XP_014779219.1 PREDICTED: uncharacterized protein LOC106875535 [Octopus bimaculoides]